MTKQMSVTRDGADWPAPGETLEVSDAEGSPQDLTCTLTPTASLNARSSSLARGTEPAYWTSAAVTSTAPPASTWPVTTMCCVTYSTSGTLPMSSMSVTLARGLRRVSTTLCCAPRCSSTPKVGRASCGRA